MDPLEALGPLDGRYRKDMEPLAKIFSEQGLISRRIQVEGEYLIYLSEHPTFGTRPFLDEERDMIRQLSSCSLDDARIVKQIETQGMGAIKATKHDVKAVEYSLGERLRGTTLEDSISWIHFGLTSEDVNNIAYGLMLQEGLETVILSAAESLYDALEELAEKYKAVSMLARTHGQPASPTTVGKEFKVFSSRLQRQLSQLQNHEILVKLNGATGNWNALKAAYPSLDCLAFTQEFIDRLKAEGRIKLRPNMVTTQIEPHDTYAELFDNLRRINTIVLDFDQDMWRYISDDWFVQKFIEGEVGSSTMPHKVNPIDFENSEGNLGMANALFEYFSRKLSVSRLQRDLSDSTVERNFGVALGYSLLGHKSALRGLKKVALNEPKVRQELEHHPEVVTEAIQTILRREGLPDAYEQLHHLARGKRITVQDLAGFIDTLSVSDEVKSELRAITPLNYIGIAPLIVENE